MIGKNGRKIYKLAAVLLAVIALSIPAATKIQAAQSTTYTYGIDRKGRFVKTQDAYLPDRTVTDLRLKSPEDIFIDGDSMFIADTGNKRIVVYDIKTDEIDREIKYEKFNTPRGIYITADGTLYVADSSAQAVFVFDSDGNFVKSYERPVSESFGETAYAPYRVAVDSRGNLYIVGEGVYNGIIQLSVTGEFLGYFTTNQTTRTFIEVLQDIFFTDKQKAGLIDRVPTTFSNVFVDHKGIVYSATMGMTPSPVKKHNMAGRDMFGGVIGIDATIDVTVGKNGIIYAADKNGFIMVYSNTGMFIFDFGSYALDLDIVGFYSSLTSIAVTDDGILWTLDGDKGFLQSYTPTEYTKSTYRAIDLYNGGYYEDARVQWNDVLRYNQMSVLAHNGIGDALISQQNYAEAATHYEVAGSRTKYSEAFWEVRNVWLQERLPAFLIVAFVVFMGLTVLKYADRKRTVKKAVRLGMTRAAGVPVLKDVLFFKYMMFHPLDGYYYLKRKEKGTVLGASILYGLFFLAFILYTTSKSYLFQLTEIEDLDMNAIVFGFLALSFLFVICNYLVTSINDGDGSISDIFKAFSYSTAPLTITLFTVTALTYVLTYNEQFLISFLFLGGGVWSCIVMFLGLQEIHNYTTGNTIKSVLFTALFMVIAIVVILILTILFNQLAQFVEAIVRELIANVMGTY